MIGNGIHLEHVDQASIGIAGVRHPPDDGDGHLLHSDGLVEAVDRPDERPVWISVWGGAHTLAQALWDVRESRLPEDLERFVSVITEDRERAVAAGSVRLPRQRDSDRARRAE